MLGLGVAKGLGITLKHFFVTYIEDLKYFPKRATQTLVDYRMAPESKGIYTVQYPEEKPRLPERFRFLPFLVTDYEGDDLAQRIEGQRCTSCGICSKVCPAQCIWIDRDTDENGKPRSKSKQFYIDADLCMNCGYCAEYCPFDSIIMDHDYALADYDRSTHIHDIDRLLKPASYYLDIRPTQYREKEEQRRREAEEKKRKAEEKAKRLAAKKAAAEAAAKAKKDAAE